MSSLPTIGVAIVALLFVGSIFGQYTVARNGYYIRQAGSQGPCPHSDAIRNEPHCRRAASAFGMGYHGDWHWG